MSRVKTYLILSLFFQLGLFMACGSLDTNSQYTNKMVADPFVAPLNSKVTKMIALDLEPGQKIAWLALNRSGDFRFFQIDDVTVNGRKIAAKTPGPEYVFNSFPPVASLSGRDESEASTVYITVTYKAKAAHANDQVNKPFAAYLLVVMEEGSGKQGNILVNLEGYVRGVCDDCKLPLDKSYVYELDDNDADGNPDLGFFICDDKAIVDIATNNISDAKGIFTLPADAATSNTYRFDFVNLDGSLVEPWKDPQPKEMVFFESDKKPGFVVLDAGDSSDAVGSPPSIPPFRIPVPSKKLPVKDIDIQMESSTQVACPAASTDGKKSFTCSDTTDSGIPLRILGSIGLNTSLLTLTTGSVAVDTKDCADFGTWQGSGTVGDDNITVVAYASVSEDQPDTVKGQKTNIEGAAVVAVIKLTKK